jgi:hypothetical protein
MQAGRPMQKADGLSAVAVPRKASTGTLRWPLPLSRRVGGAGR